MSRVYVTAGNGWLICPRLRELDPRHATHTSKWPACWHGRDCLADHPHEKPVKDGQRHSAVMFVWAPGSRHVTEHDNLVRCECGAELVHGDFDDPFTQAAS